MVVVAATGVDIREIRQLESSMFSRDQKLRLGIAIAQVLGMGANDFTELIAWQRADELERFALEMIKRPVLARDQTFCQQTTDCASSAPRNIAEGHGRFAPPQFANFLRIAIGSEQETRNQIIKAWQRGAITDEEKKEGLMLSKRALAAAVRLRQYLLSPSAKANAKAIENRANLSTSEPKITSEPKRTSEPK